MTMLITARANNYVRSCQNSGRYIDLTQSQFKPQVSTKFGEAPAKHDSTAFRVMVWMFSIGMAILGITMMARAGAFSSLSEGESYLGAIPLIIAGFVIAFRETNIAVPTKTSIVVSDALKKELTSKAAEALVKWESDFAEIEAGRLNIDQDETLLEEIQRTSQEAMASLRNISRMKWVKALEERNVDWDFLVEGIAIGQNHNFFRLSAMISGIERCVYFQRIGNEIFGPDFKEPNNELFMELMRIKNL